jgi:hypothetical protein
LECVENDGAAGLLLEVLVVPLVARADLFLDSVLGDRILIAIRLDVTSPDVLMQFLGLTNILIY